jgi:serine/threonine-protein kinase
MKAGVRFGRYTIESSLGRGGMGEVYVALDERMRRRVALKVLHADEQEKDGHARLLREARAAAAFDHPNAVRIFDVDEVAGIAFLTMELLEGRTLRARLREGRTPLAMRVGWLVSIARTLQAAHAKGIVHRDVKPENVMILADDTVKVLDFGLARRVQVAADPAVTTQLDSGATEPNKGVGGTLLYMAPEQLRDEKLDGAADQWAWGIVAYEVLTGAPPWHITEGTLAVISQVLAREPEAPSARSVDVSPAMDRVVLKALAKTRNARFPNVGDAADALARATNGGALEVTEAQPVAPRSGATPPRGRRWRGVAGIGGALLLLAGAFAVARVRGGLRVAVVAEAGARDAEGPDEEGYLSKDPEALASYREGLQASRDAAPVLVVRARMERAVARDPLFTAAQLRNLLTWENPESEGRAFFAKILAGRARLSPHDRALLDAVEPWFREPADAPEMRRRFARLASAGDADFDLQRCFFLIKAHENTEALQACRDARGLDASIAAASLGEGLALTALGDADGASQAFRACIDRSPEGALCFTELAKNAARGGRCDDFEELTRRLVAMQPHDAYAHFWRAKALYAKAIRGDGSFAAYDAVADATVPLLEGADVRAQPFLFTLEKAVAEGEFDLARSAAEGFEREYAPSNSEDALRLALGDEAELLVELGRTRDAVALAKRWLVEQRSWQPSAVAGSRIIPMGFLYALGGIARSQFVEERTSWIASERARGADRDAAMTWMSAFGRPTVSAEDAAEALDALPSGLVGPQPVAFQATLGRVLLLAGRPAEAAEELRLLTSSCEAWSDPIPYFRAFTWLGEALAAQGAANESCAAFAFVVQHWGSTPSVSAAKARTEFRNFHCGRDVLR